MKKKRYQKISLYLILYIQRTNYFFSIIRDSKNPKIIPVQICVLIPENNSIDKIGNINVLTKVIQHTIPFCLSLEKSSRIFFTFMSGTTEKITITPNVDLGRSKSKGVA